MFGPLREMSLKVPGQEATISLFPAFCALTSKGQVQGNVDSGSPTLAEFIRWCVGDTSAFHRTAALQKAGANC